MIYALFYLFMKMEESSRHCQEWKFSTFLNVSPKFCHGSCIQILWRPGHSWDFNGPFKETQDRNHSALKSNSAPTALQKGKYIYVPEYFPGLKHYFTAQHELPRSKQD